MLTLLATLAQVALHAPVPCGILSLTVDSLAPGVYAAYQRQPFPSMLYLEGNSTIIINSRDVVVVDAGSSPPAGRCLVRIVESLTHKPVRYLINTHWHGDHTLGNQAFVDAYPGVEIVGSRLTLVGETGNGARNAADLAHDITSRRAQGATLIADAEKGAAPGRDSVIAMLHRYYDHDLVQRQRDYAQVHVAPPTLIVDDSLTLRRGDREIRVFHIGKGDAAGTLVVYLPHERILMSADLVVAPIPFGYTKEQEGWRTTLDRIDSIPYAVLVPGHGDPLRSHDYVRSIARLIDSTRAEAQRLAKPGWDADSVLAHMDSRAIAEPFVHDSPTLRFFFDQYFLIPFVSQMLEPRGS